MKRTAAKYVQALKRLLLDESGQGMAEYASISTILIFGGIAAGAAWPYTSRLIIGLQGYINFYFYCLNLAIG